MAIVRRLDPIKLDRKIPGKKSQSIRFSPEAVDQLQQILNKKF